MNILFLYFYQDTVNHVCPIYLWDAPRWVLYDLSRKDRQLAFVFSF